MKKPRVEDFDPNAAPPLASPLENLPVIEPPKQRANLAPVVPLKGTNTPQPTSNKGDAKKKTIETASQRETRPNAPPPVRPYGSTPVRRVITRYAFEFFQDQIETLRNFSLEEKLRGEKGSMSEMVREGIDMYISKRRNRDEA